MTQSRPRQPRMPLDVRREQVLDAALRLILRDGYAAATMEAVAREAQLAKPRVYSAYPGRGPLLLTLLEREQRRMITALADAMPAFTEDTGFDATLVVALTNLLTTVTENPDAWRLLMLAADDTPPEVRQYATTGREFALQRLRDLLEWGRGRRPGLDELDLELAAQSLFAMGEQAVRLVLTNPGSFTSERYAAFAGSLLGLLPNSDGN